MSVTEQVKRYFYLRILGVITRCEHTSICIVIDDFEAEICQTIKIILWNLHITHPSQEPI